MKPPVETATSLAWQSSIISAMTGRGMSANDPPANLSESI
jgi:hypothetical protein